MHKKPAACRPRPQARQRMDHRFSYPISFRGFDGHGHTATTVPMKVHIEGSINGNVLVTGMSVLIGTEWITLDPTSESYQRAHSYLLSNRRELDLLSRRWESATIGDIPDDAPTLGAEHSDAFREWWRLARRYSTARSSGDDDLSACIASAMDPIEEELFATSADSAISTTVAEMGVVALFWAEKADDSVDPFCLDALDVAGTTRDARARTHLIRAAARMFFAAQTR